MPIIKTYAKRYNLLPYTDKLSLILILKIKPMYQIIPIILTYLFKEVN